jgi:prevent-host-death family protein
MALQLVEMRGRKHITATNARVNFCALLDYIKATGETVIITVRGTPKAKISPAAPSGGR